MSFPRRTAVQRITFSSTLYKRSQSITDKPNNTGGLIMWLLTRRLPGATKIHMSRQFVLFFIQWRITHNHYLSYAGFSLGRLHTRGICPPHMGGGEQVQGDKALMGVGTHEGDLTLIDYIIN